MLPPPPLCCDVLLKKAIHFHNFFYVYELQNIKPVCWTWNYMDCAALGKQVQSVLPSTLCAVSAQIFSYCYAQVACTAMHLGVWTPLAEQKTMWTVIKTVSLLLFYYTPMVMMTWLLPCCVLTFSLFYCSCGTRCKRTLFIGNVSLNSLSGLIMIRD